jgi:stage V sporulation protein SpoVS
MMQSLAQQEEQKREGKGAPAFRAAADTNQADLTSALIVTLRKKKRLNFYAATAKCLHKALKCLAFTRPFLNQVGLDTVFQVRAVRPGGSATAVAPVAPRESKSFQAVVARRRALPLLSAQSRAQAAGQALRRRPRQLPLAHQLLRAAPPPACCRST